MKKKLSILIALVLVLSLCLVTAAPVVAAGPGDFSGYSPPGSPDVTVSTTAELEVAVMNGADETILVKAGTYTPTWDGAGYMKGLKVEDSDQLYAEYAPDSANPSIIEGGLQIDTVGGVTVSGFKVNGGISLWVSSCEVSSNIILTNGVGISLMGNDNLVINNKISGSGDPEDAGIHIQASGNTVQYNTIAGFTAGEDPYYSHGRKGAGVCVWTNTDDTTIEYNIIKDNTVGIMVTGPDREGVTSATNVVVNNNNIEGNADYGVFNAKCPGNGDSWTYWEYEKYTLADSTVDAIHNWWGSADGPFGTEANLVSDYVDYDPWYDSPIVFTTGGSTKMTARYTPTPPPVISISVSPTSVDFGDIAPGVASDPQSVTITNTGDVTVDLTASLTNISTPDVYTTGLVVASGLVADWEALDVAVDDTATPRLILTVLSGTPAGTYTATLVFWAEASP